MSALKVTVFGATGFLGRALVRHLIRSHSPEDVTIRLASRNRTNLALPSNVHHVSCDLTNPTEVTAALSDATHVVNLVGILHETPGTARTFSLMHDRAVQTLADGLQHDASSFKNVRSVVHVSAIGADSSSASAYARSKKAGEEAISRVASSKGDISVSILRPSVVFGPEDTFLNRFAAMTKISPMLPLVGEGLTKFQPVHVDDVAQAISAALGLGEERRPAGVYTYHLGGGKVLTFRQLMELVMKMSGRRRVLLPIPFAVASMQGALFEGVHRMVPSIPPILTRDQVTLLRQDNVVGEDVLTLESMKLSGRACDETTTTYLR